MEDKLSTLITDSSNTINSEVSGQLIKEKTQSVQRLEQLVKEQKGKIDQLTGENAASQQQLEELQVGICPVSMLMYLDCYTWIVNSTNFYV